jgi:hypothetical protein
MVVVSLQLAAISRQGQFLFYFDCFSPPTGPAAFIKTSQIQAVIF